MLYAAKGTERSHHRDGETAGLVPNSQADLPPWLLPHTRWSQALVSQTSLITSIACRREPTSTILYLVTQTTGGRMYKTVENCWRLRDPQNYGGANPGLYIGGGCQHGVCKSVWSNPGGAVSQLWL